MSRSGKVKGKQYFRYSLGIVLMVLIDQLSKVMAINHLRGQESVSLIKNVLELNYLENLGAAFGAFSGKRAFLVIFTLLLTGVIGYRLICLPEDKKYQGMKLCLIATISGALGNLIDRIFRGYVVDFIYFVPIDFPKFNVADSYIVVSLFVLMIMLFTYYNDKEAGFLLSLKKRIDE